MYLLKVKDIGLMDKINCDFGLIYMEITKEKLNDYSQLLSYLIVFYIEKGEALITIDFKDYKLEKGNFIVVGEDNFVAFKNVSDTFLMHCFFIQRDFASEIAYVLPNELFGYLHYYPVQRFSPHDVMIYNAWHLLSLNFLQTTKENKKKIICNHLQILFLNISESVNYKELILEKHYSRQEELCWKFWDLIGKYAKTHREVSFYAEQLFVTPYYLSKITQQFLNYSPKELINRQVILHVKHYLATTDLNLSQIADQLNFSDPSYMGRFFKRETGCNPIQFRKK